MRSDIHVGYRNKNADSMSITRDRFQTILQELKISINLFTV